MSDSRETEATISPSPQAAPASAGEATFRDIATATKYRLKRRIASGGMGSVFEAEQFGAQGFAKTVAIKVLLPELSENSEFVSMFIGEAKLVACLVHPNIIQIYQLGRSDEGYFIAMEYIDGIDMLQFINRHRQLGRQVPVELAVYIASRVCRGLEYAHNKRDENGELLDIVHRDVSPRNIMITSEGEVKLGDFGVAKARRHAGGKVDGNVMVGKVGYMPPEQALYKPTDRRSDIFSLGVVFYELLTGRRVFDRESEVVAINQLLHGSIPDPRTFRPEIPDKIVEIVLRCLQRDPAGRYQMAGDMGYDLEYHMYSKGYGPTILTLAKYTAQICPERRFYLAPSRGDDLHDSVVRGGSSSRRGEGEASPIG